MAGRHNHALTFLHFHSGLSQRKYASYVAHAGGAVMSMIRTFPGGRRVIETIVTTAGNVVTNLSPGAHVRWIVLWGKITLVADATAANRYFTYVLTDGTNVTFDLPYVSSAITAGQTKAMVLTNYWTKDGNMGTPNIHCLVALPNPCILEGNDQLRITITSGQAGDSYSGFVVVLEMSS